MSYSYSFDNNHDRWETLSDTFDSYLEDLDALEQLDKDTEDPFSIPAFDELEVL
jgi:hypothetical protein